MPDSGEGLKVYECFIGDMTPNDEKNTFIRDRKTSSIYV